MSLVKTAVTSLAKYIISRPARANHKDTVDSLTRIARVTLEENIALKTELRQIRRTAWTAQNTDGDDQDAHRIRQANLIRNQKAQLDQQEERIRELHEDCEKKKAEWEAHTDTIIKRKVDLVEGKDRVIRELQAECIRLRGEVGPAVAEIANLCEERNKLKDRVRELEGIILTNAESAKDQNDRLRKINVELLRQNQLSEARINPNGTPNEDQAHREYAARNDAEKLAAVLRGERPVNEP